MENENSSNMSETRSEEARRLREEADYYRDNNK